MHRKKDSEVEQWVLRELSLSEIRSREICVFTSDGVVTLRGSAETHQEKLAAEQAALRATGVVGVVNTMRVKPSTALIEKVPFRPVQPGCVSSVQSDSTTVRKNGRGVMTSQSLRRVKRLLTETR